MHKNYDSWKHVQNAIIKLEQKKKQLENITKGWMEQIAEEEMHCRAGSASVAVAVALQ